MAGINFDTANTGYGGNYGGGAYGYGSTNILDLAALGLVFGDGFGRKGYGGDKCGCCAPATCEQVNDCDRDVLKSAFETTEAVHDEGRTVDRDVLIGVRDILDRVCKSEHCIEDKVRDVKDEVFKTSSNTNQHLDQIAFLLDRGQDKTQNILIKGIDEIKCLVKTTDLERATKEQAKENEALREKLNKLEIIQALDHKNK